MTEPTTNGSARRFSRRTSWDATESILARSIREAREAGRSLLDLTISNPTKCEFAYDAEMTLGALGDVAAMVYDPDPKGIRSAREAVATYYADHEAAVDPDQIVLTSSTSEAYSFLFRLLCDAGDAVMVAQPSYPLFDFVADLDEVALISYPLFEDFGWWIDFQTLEERITPRTRAVLLVHPNNPTGHTTTGAERQRLEEICVRHGLALIVDEVFLDYGLESPPESFAGGPHPCLTFVVSGMSKIAALPQMKVAWIATFGPESERQVALSRLEIVADTFLSLNAPVQHALPHWLASRASMQQQVLRRVCENLRAIDAAGVTVLPVEAGWSAILRLAQLSREEELSLALVKGPGIVAHPGSFYGLAGEHRVVVSLITPAALFREGLELLRRWSASG